MEIMIQCRYCMRFITAKSQLKLSLKLKEHLESVHPEIYIQAIVVARQIIELQERFRHLTGSSRYQTYRATNRDDLIHHEKGDSQ